MTTPQEGTSAGGSNSTTQEYIVRAPRDKKKAFKMMKFSTGTEIDFVKLSQTPVKMERENNLREFKTANDIDLQPKYGAGSEFGREQKEEARRKKYGIMKKKYNPNDQPWILKIGSGKQGTKKFKGVREGTITENTSYYIFMQCADGAFEAFPVDEWYSFSPLARYKFLNSDEAEDEYMRRDKTLNLFTVMVRKRLRNEDDKDADLDTDEGEKSKSKKQSKKSKEKKDFMLTDMDDWANSSDDDGDDEDDDKPGEDGDGKKKPKKTDKKTRTIKNAKHNSDDEAVEESDEGDFDDREVDYMTSGSESSFSDAEDRDKDEKYGEKGVDQERGLQKILDSEESSEEEEEKKDEDKKEKDKKEKKEKDKKNGSDSDSSSSSSDSDSDLEKEGKLTGPSAIFMQKQIKRESPIPRPATPSSNSGEDKKVLKRKLEPEESSSKKVRTDSPSIAGSSEGLTEEAIRRYLMRKPMTTKELMQKFKSKKLNMTKEEMTCKIAKLLKKIAPETKTVNQVLYLSLKK